MKKHAFILSLVLAAAGQKALWALPEVYLKGVASGDAQTIALLENGYWINTTSPTFNATGSAHYHYNVNYSSIANTTANVFDPGWNGVYQPGAALGLFGNQTAPGNTTQRDINTALGGFALPGEGHYVLTVLGDAGLGVNNHNNNGLADNVAFVFKVDQTLPQISTLRAQFSSSDTQPINSGESTSDNSPYFFWTAGDAANTTVPVPTAVSGLRGFTWSFSASNAVAPVTSTSSANFLTANTLSLSTGPFAPGTYYYKVRTVDRAGNWSAPMSFTYVTGVDAAAPAVQAASFSVGGVAEVTNGRRVAVGLDADVRVQFSETMYQSKMTNAALPGLVLRQLRNSQWQTATATIPATVTYDATSRTATLNPTAALAAGALYEIRTTTNARDAADNALPLYTLEFMTVVDPAVATTLSDGQGASLVIPAQALALTGGVALNPDPVGAPMASAGLSTIIQEANGNVRRNAFAQPISLREINFYDTDGNRVASPIAGEVDLTISYTDANNDGIVDGSNPPVREATLAIHRLDEGLKTWLRVPGSVVDAENNTVTAPLRQFSVYGILGAPVLDLSAAYAFPVPFKPSLGHSSIYFASLSSVATIRIYTTSGELVRELHETNGDGVYEWDVKNDKGEPLASDLFIYLIENDQQQKTGKLLVGR